ncbi:TPA: hypothetical protein ACP32N_005102 [Pseudomonas aeruginosa]
MNRVAHPLELHDTYYGVITDSVMMRIVAQVSAAAQMPTPSDQAPQSDGMPTQATVMRKKSPAGD